MSLEERESEVKSVGKKGAKQGSPPRDPTMTGGERAETPEEKARNKRERERPKEPPIIQKDVT